MKRFRRELSINIDVDCFVSKNNQITRFPCFTFIPKTGIGIPKKGISYSCGLFSDRHIKSHIKRQISANALNLHGHCVYQSKN